MNNNLSASKAQKNKVNKNRAKKARAKTTFFKNPKARLFLALFAVICSVSLLAVGAYSAIAQGAEITIGNQITLEVSGVQGTLYAKRIGGSEPDYNAGGDFLMKPIYSYGASADEEALNALQKAVNVTDGSRKIEYTFKFVTGSSITKNTQINVVTSDINHADAGKVIISYYYYVGETEPADWSTANVLTPTIGDATGTSLIVGQNKTIYVYCALETVSKHSVHIGTAANPLNWNFSFSLTDTAAEATV